MILPILPGLLLFGFFSGPAVRPKAAPRLSFLENGSIRLGVDLDRGGAIGYLADARRRENIVNVHDLGRWIGPAFYSGPRPFGKPHPGWKNWPWNPVSAGDVYGNSSKVLAHRNDGKTLYVKSCPAQWALNNVPGKCTLETWITLDGRATRVRHRLTNHRADRTQFPAMDQELPAIYTTSKLGRLVTYAGAKPFTGAPLKDVPPRPATDPQPAWSRFTATEHWAARVDGSGWGLGVFHPGVIQFTGGSFGKPEGGGPADSATGYVAPLRREVLDHNIVYEFEYVLILDSLANIRKYVYQHRPKAGPPDYRFTRDRQHWWYVNVRDSGAPIRGKLHVRLDQDDPQLIGPEGLWDAADAPNLYIRAAFHTKAATAEVFWRTPEKAEFAGDRRVAFPVKADGRFHTYEVDLTRSSAYRGKITGLRFDPVPWGKAGDFVDVTHISFQKPEAPMLGEKGGRDQSRGCFRRGCWRR